MKLLRIARRLAVGFAISGLLFAAVPARAADATTTITGTVRNGAGVAVPGAVVAATGPARVTAVTDENGAFLLTVPAGVYRVTVTKPGYVTASTPDVAVTAGQAVPLTVTVAEVSLSTLRTIATVTTTGTSATQINLGAAAQNVISGGQFARIASPQLNDALATLPDVVVQKLGTGPETRSSSVGCSRTRRKYSSTVIPSRSGNTAFGRANISRPT